MRKDPTSMLANSAIVTVAKEMHRDRIANKVYTISGDEHDVMYILGIAPPSVAFVRARRNGDAYEFADACHVTDKIPEERELEFSLKFLARIVSYATEKATKKTKLPEPSPPEIFVLPPDNKIVKELDSSLESLGVDIAKLYEGIK
jgi:hypothetical protein